MTQPIVVAVSAGEPGLEAVALSVGMARVLHAPLVLAGVAVPPGSLGPSAVPGWIPPYPDPAALRADVHDAVSGFVALVPDDVTCEVEAVTARSVVEGLDDVAARHEAALLVIGSSPLSTAARCLRGDVALGCLRHASCPVLVVPDADRRRVSGRAPKVVGVAWDRSPEAAAALASAVDLAEQAGAELWLLHVVEPIASTAVPYLEPATYAQLHVGEREQAERDAERVAAAARRRVPTTVLVREGLVSTELEAFTQAVDLLVVGSRRRGPLRRAALGSTSESAVHQAHCPLLVVPRGARAAVAA